MKNKMMLFILFQQIARVRGMGKITFDSPDHGGVVAMKEEVFNYIKIILCDPHQSSVKISPLFYKFSEKPQPAKWGGGYIFALGRRMPRNNKYCYLHIIGQGWG